MRNFMFGIFDYLIESKTARAALYWGSWLMICACAYSLDTWLYVGVLFGALLNHIHGQVDATASIWEDEK